MGSRKTVFSIKSPLKSVKRSVKMKKKFWLAAGIACMFFAQPLSNVEAEPRIRGPRPAFVFLESQGFSISTGISYNILLLEDRYYVEDNGRWYSSSYFRGPWVEVRHYNLPYKIKRLGSEDIRRYRDIAERRQERRDEREFRHDRGDRHDYRDRRP
jgi:hypothetical protein